MKDQNNIDEILESFFNRGVDESVKRFNYLEEDEFDWDTYEFIINNEEE